MVFRWNLPTLIVPVVVICRSGITIRIKRTSLTLFWSRSGLLESHSDFISEVTSNLCYRRYFSTEERLFYVFCVEFSWSLVHKNLLLFGLFCIQLLWYFMKGRWWYRWESVGFFRLFTIRLDDQWYPLFETQIYPGMTKLHMRSPCPFSFISEVGVLLVERTRNCDTDGSVLLFALQMGWRFYADHVNWQSSLHHDHLKSPSVRFLSLCSRLDVNKLSLRCLA